MNTKTILGALIGIAVIGGGAWYFSQSGSTDIEKTTDSTTAAASGKGSLATLFARGGNFQCTFTSSDPNAQSRGTVFISGEKIRGDFESTVTGVGAVSSHMIQNDGYVYSWSSAAPIGFKAKAMKGEGDAKAGLSSSQSFDAGVDVAYDCKAWTPDVSKFTVPSTVNFMEAPTAAY